LGTWCGEAVGSVVVRTEADAVILTLKSCSSASGESKSLGQRVPLVWTRCHLGGARPWFQCTGHSDGQGCGRRAAKLYLGRSSAFACRCCHNLAYASQSENPRYRAISRAQKLRMRLGASANLLERFPPKPRGMHRRTYYRLLGQGDGGAGAPDRAGERLFASALSRSFEPTESRRELISATTGCSEPAGGPRGKFLDPAGAHGREWLRPSCPSTTLGPL
jgi:hypothetical protein